MAINDIGEQAMAAQKAREATIRRVQQATMPVSNPSARAAGNAAVGIADRIPQGPATQPPSPALQSQGANIASRPAAGPASSIASQKPVMQSPVDRDFAQARVEQAARFDTPKPGAAPSATAAPAAQSQSAAFRAGQKTKEFVGSNQPRAGTGGLLAITGIASAADSVSRDTADYYKRLGMDPTNVSLPRDLAARTAGVVSDFGAAILDTPVDVINSFGGNMQPFRTMFADRADEWKEEQPAAAQSQPAQTQAAQQAAQPAGIAEIPQQGGSSARDQIDPVMGTFNGQPLRKSDLAAKSETIGLVSGAPAQPQNNAKTITDGLLGRMDSQDATFTNLVKGNLGRRDDRAARSEERLNKLQGMFETAMFQGKRRTAAIIAQAMQAEGSNLSSLSGGNIPDVRRNTQIDPNAAANEGKIAAEAGESEASANKDRVETSRQQRINDVMGAFLDDPNSEAGQQAARTLQTINGKQSDRLYPVDVQVGTDATGAPVMGKGLFDPNGGGLEYSPNGQGIAGGIQQGGAQLPEGAATLAGYDRKTGKPVYLDAQGNQVIEE